MENRVGDRWGIWIVAVGVGGVCGILFALGRLPNAEELKPAVVIGWVGLLASPLFLGILAGLARPFAPIRTGLGLSAVCLLVAMPLMGEGLICLVVIAPVAVVVAPAAAGLIGYAVRAQRRRFEGGRRVELLLLALPALGVLWERLDPPPLPAPVVLTDSVEVRASPEEVWRSMARLHLRFEVPTPWQVFAGLPAPVALEGGGAHVGAERRLRFDNGEVLATVTRSVHARRIDMRLSVEHSGREFFDHWSILGDSTFLFEPLDGGGTRITHQTAYVPLSLPRWYFEPVERALGSRVQRYMLEAYVVQVLREGSPRVAAR